MSGATTASTTAEIALGRISGAVPSELGAWALHSSGAASGAFLMAFWPSDLGDGTLYTDAQLQAMSRAATRVRFRFIEDEQGRMQVYGIHTSAASGMDSVPIVQARQEGSALVAAVPGGPTLTWYPDSSSEVPDASSYYPERDGMEVSNILVRPIPEAPDAELETFPAAEMTSKIALSPSRHHWGSRRCIWYSVSRQLSCWRWIPIAAFRGGPESVLMRIICPLLRR